MALANMVYGVLHKAHPWAYSKSQMYEVSRKTKESEESRASGSVQGRQRPRFCPPGGTTGGVEIACGAAVLSTPIRHERRQLRTDKEGTI